MEKEKLKGGLSDSMSLYDIAKKHDPTNPVIMFKKLKTQLQKGIEIEKEHTKNLKMAREIAKDHLYENPGYYDKLEDMEGEDKETETTEATSGSSSGAFSSPFPGGKVKRPIGTIHNFNESTDGSSTGAYDVAFNSGNGKDPLKISGEKSIKKSRAVKDKKFPRYGGPEAVYVKVKDKCKKFPYCNQGDIKSLEFFEDEKLIEAVKKTSKKMGLPYSDVEKVVLNEIKKIFI